jgi:hypothetical protein
MPSGGSVMASFLPWLVGFIFLDGKPETSPWIVSWFSSPDINAGETTTVFTMVVEVQETASSSKHCFVSIVLPLILHLATKI